MELEWQSNLSGIRKRCQHLLSFEKWTDCRFLVGSKPNQRLISSHRVLLAAGSPVFESMFFGSLPEMTNPIIIPDVQPDAFKAMLEFIYADLNTIGSIDKAFDLYYAAKKYMLPQLMTNCTEYMIECLSAKNVCRAYEFANFNDESSLMQNSMDFIVKNTHTVLINPNSLDVEASTLMAILDQNRLNINSEIELFDFLLKLASDRGILKDNDNNEVPSDCDKFTASAEHTDINSDASGNANAEMNPEETATKMNIKIYNWRTILRQAVKKIRFLNMTPQQFANGPARSKLLKKHESLDILINIISPTLMNDNMPEGFCVSRLTRKLLESSHSINNPRPIFKFSSINS